MLRLPRTLRLKTRLTVAACVVAALLAVVGCREPRKLTSESDDSGSAATLRLAVFGDPGLAGAIGLLKSEWHAQNGSEIEIVEMDDRPVGDMPELPADAIIFPAGRLGEWVELDRIVPLPKDVLASEELSWPDVFPVVQTGDASYGGRVVAVPFGSPALTLCYRRDLFDKFDRKPPQTWQEYAAEVRFFQDRERLGDLAPGADIAWSSACEPLAPGWAGQMLLARAAAYARHRDNFSTLFKIDDLEPLIDGPPFVRALEELVAAAKISAQSDTAQSDTVQSNGGDAKSPSIPRLDPAGVRSALMSGACAMAVTWPTAAGNRKDTPAVMAQIGFAELPGAEQSFNFATHSWDARTADEPIHVPLTPIAGRLGAVVKNSANADAAFRLLSWLSGPKWGTQVSASSAATSLYRKSQADSPQKWVESGAPVAVARQYAAVAGRALSRPVWFHALRIPGCHEYQAALDVAVEQALAGEQKPDEALHSAAKNWREISERLGVDRQLKAYRASLGLD